MTTSLMVLQAIISILLIIVVLLQFGKGAEAGLMTAAGSESIMSSSTRGNVMTKITAVLAVLFLGNSILLARLQDTKFQKSILDTEAPISRPLNSDATTAPAATAPAATTPAATAPATTTPAAATKEATQAAPTKEAAPAKTETTAPTTAPKAK
ncbi:preprotein translocase subunit SecG [Bacteriovorax sp. PP10]|uniref:Protein-export membrane protein SecG n=1 Tax=Bacteriovorax antarcticus TaxID=3088717 RepID=A0ABU5VUW4_9BACT|nr:preprotein translocase subunit SecG [Bacteriovorax sp. PP10]MEA9356846.1 preprotein translocase subunit SecG [Bacteriovorax sp. PP10]